MSDPRDDDEPVSIEADAPEADWIEQHQPVSDEDDDDTLYSSEVRANEAGISIESDTPEADWIEQHQPIGEAPDEERLPSAPYPSWMTVNSSRTGSPPTRPQAQPTIRKSRLPLPSDLVVVAMFWPPSPTPRCVMGATPPANSEGATDARPVDAP